MRRLERTLAGILATLALFAARAGSGEPGAVQAAAAAGPAVPVAADTASAVACVERLHGVLIEVMQQADALGYAGRRDRLAPVLGELFDLAFMAEKSVGRYWKEASAEDRASLVDTFTRYTVANYAGRFDGFSGQAFETLGTEASARGMLLVRTKLSDPNGEDVTLDYRMRSVDGRWKIIDIYMNGTVSELALRRSEYSSLIKREGFKALLAALDERIESLATAPADQAS
jgi:phospholipid transport system substrate-binding protein